MEISSNHHNFQTVRARDLKFWHNVHHPICVMCHMSRVTCHMSCVTCHKKKIQSGGASQLRVCYHRGQPCLVFFCFIRIYSNKVGSILEFCQLSCNQVLSSLHFNPNHIQVGMKLLKLEFYFKLENLSYIYKTLRCQRDMLKGTFTSK